MKEYTVEVPVRFKFRATEKVDSELLKQANAYIDLYLLSGDYEYDAEQVKIVKKEPIFAIKDGKAMTFKEWIQREIK